MRARSSSFHCSESAGTFFSSHDDGTVSSSAVGSVSVVVVGLGLRLSDCNHAQRLVSTG